MTHESLCFTLRITSSHLYDPRVISSDFSSLVSKHSNDYNVYRLSFLSDSAVLGPISDDFNGMMMTYEIRRIIICPAYTGGYWHPLPQRHPSTTIRITVLLQTDSLLN